jgi:hypothetical protein
MVASLGDIRATKAIMGSVLLIIHYGISQDNISTVI